MSAPATHKRRVKSTSSGFGVSSSEGSSGSSAMPQIGHVPALPGELAGASGTSISPPGSPSAQALAYRRDRRLGSRRTWSGTRRCKNDIHGRRARHGAPSSPDRPSCRTPGPSPWPHRRAPSPEQQPPILPCCWTSTGAVDAPEQHDEGSAAGSASFAEQPQPRHGMRMRIVHGVTPSTRSLVGSDIVSRSTPVHSRPHLNDTRPRPVPLGDLLEERRSAYSTVATSRVGN